MDQMEDTIKVACRVRPADSNAAQGSCSKRCVTVDTTSHSIVVHSRPEVQNFGFDFVGGEESTQEDFFQAVGLPITEACIQGYNGTILCYGQTGSGKTHTLFGSGISEGPQRGLVPRIMEYLWQHFVRESHRTNGALTFSCKCSFYEIYQEKVFDLLDIAGNPTQNSGLNVREDSKTGVFIEGLVEENVTSSEDASRVLARGYGNRRVGETTMNRESSRSHAVFLLKIDRFEEMLETGVRSCRSARFSLVDLAGSERQRDTNASGERLKEASQINKSLSALGNVINALASNHTSGSSTQKKHIQYRDSKLTFLLRDSFGGNSKTLLIATASPSESAMAETLSTLKFARRAKLIKTAAVINEESSGTVQGLQKEITHLRARIAEMEESVNESAATEAGGVRRSIGRISSGLGISNSTVPNAAALLDALERCRVVDGEYKKAREKAYQIEKFSSEMKMKLKMRESEIMRLKKKAGSDEDIAVPSVEEVVKIETNAVRQELQCEILRLRTQCVELEKQVGADVLKYWNAEKEVTFGHTQEEVLSELRTTYASLFAKFEGLRSEKFEAIFEFPYERVGALLEIESEHAALIDELREERSKAECSRLALKTACEKATSAEKKIAEMESQRNADQITIEDLERDVTEKEETIDALKCDVTTSHQSRQELEMENLKKFNEEKKNNMILNRRAKELESTIEKSEEVISELEETVEAMKTTEKNLNEKLEIEKQESSDRLKSLNAEIFNLRNQLTDATTEANSLNFQLNDANEKAFAYEANLRRAETTTAQLQMDLEKSQAELEKAVEDSENLLAANNALASSEQELAKSNKAHLVKISDLESQLTDWEEKSAKDDEARYTAVVDQLDVAKSNIAELSQKLESTQLESVSKKEEILKLAEQCSFYSESISSLQTAVQDLRTQIREKEASFSDLQSEFEDKREEVMALVTSNDSLKEELLNLQNEKSMIVTTTLRSDKEKVASLEFTVGNLQSELDELREITRVYEQENEAITGSLKAEQERNIELTQQLSVAKAENANLAGHQNTKQKIHQTMNMKKEITEQAEQIKAQQATIISLTNKIAVLQKDQPIGGPKKGSRKGAASSGAPLGDIRNEQSCAAIGAELKGGMATRASRADDGLEKSAFDTV